MYRLGSVLLVLCTAVACGGGGSPTSPSASSGSTSSTSQGVRGQTVDAVTGSPAGNLSVVVGSYRAVTTDANGMFTLDGARPGTYAATLRGASIVERETTFSASSDLTRLSVIPATLDLVAFDEMFRSDNARLERWMSRPSLVVVASTMALGSTSADTFQASSEQMTDDEVSVLVAQMTEGLSLLTGGTFTSFETVEIERPGAGVRVSATRTGKIVVGRYTGVVSLANTIGYGRWSNLADGTVVGGAMFLDRDFDKNDSRRRLLRIHELGHALGYQHVKSRPSIMNPAIGPEPTDFDRAGAIVAFQRLPGNRSPDVDPAGGTRTWSVAEGGARWSEPTVCR
jgi:Matrixin